MGQYHPSEEERNNPELFRKNYAKRAKLRAATIVVVYTACVLGMIALVVLKHCGGE